MEDGERIGVFAFFSRRRIGFDDRLHGTLDTVSREIGRLLTRQRVAASTCARESQLRSIIDQAPISTLLYTVGGEMLSINQEVTRSLGWAHEDVPDVRAWLEKVRRIPDERLDLAVQRLRERRRESETPEPEEVAVYSTSGEERRWIFYRSPLIELPDGRSMVASMAVDVTERRATEKALQQARQAAETASASKSEFLANVSHEIRTPMTAIVGYADVLKEKLSEDELLECVRTIKRNGLYLIDIINDILDLSRIEAGRLEIHRQRFSPVDLVRDVRNLMRVRSEEKGIDLRLRFQDPQPAHIESDPTRLRQILINLVGNAIKFTEEGSVELVCEILEGDVESNLRLSVIDTGRGVPENERQGLFEPFTQGNRAQAGTGLGLSISRRLAQFLGGSLVLEKSDDGGSVFSLTVPAGSLEGIDRIQPHPDLDEPDDDPLQDLPRLDATILVVDDQREIRVAEYFLVGAGARVHQAANGAEALDLEERLRAANEPVDLVLLDMQMPRKNGYEVAAELRERGFSGRIVALTAAAMPGDRDRVLAAGCDAHLAKPIDFERLMHAIARQLTPLSGDGGRRTILLVEDDESSRAALKTLLEAYGHEVAEAASGTQAVELFSRMRADVVLLDLTLPDNDGHQVRKMLDEQREDDPVLYIAISGRSSRQEIDHALSTGFDDYLVKPIDFERLKQLLARGAE